MPDTKYCIQLTEGEIALLILGQSKLQDQTVSEQLKSATEKMMKKLRKTQEELDYLIEDY